MIASLVFSFVAAAMVLVAGRRDAARDPRLTLLLLSLLIALPLLGMCLPKIAVLPISENSEGESTWARWVMIVWGAGFMVSTIKLILAGIGIACWRRRSVLVDCADGVEIRKLAGLRGPVAAGIFRKMVFVPEGFGTWSTERQQIVLAHELAHHRRHDPLWRLCVEIARAIYWYHPAVHWMAARFALQSECACDELVLRGGAKRKTYAGLLCDLAESGKSRSLVLAMAETSSLEKRIARMIYRKEKRGGAMLAALGLAGIGIACAFSMISGKAPVDAQEVELRLKADPFPGGR